MISKFNRTAVVSASLAVAAAVALSACGDDSTATTNSTAAKTTAVSSSSSSSRAAEPSSSAPSAAPSSTADAAPQSDESVPPENRPQVDAPATQAPGDPEIQLDDRQKKFVEALKRQGVDLPPAVSVPAGEAACGAKQGKVDEPRARSVVSAAIGTIYATDPGKAQATADKVWNTARTTMC